MGKDRRCKFCGRTFRGRCCPCRKRKTFSLSRGKRGVRSGPGRRWRADQVLGHEHSHGQGMSVDIVDDLGEEINAAVDVCKRISDGLRELGK